jgi:hypothetical protein
MFRKIINLLIFIKNNINKDLNVAYFTALFISLIIICII